MAWWNRSRRTVDIDALAPEDRAWLEQEADRIAVDPVTFVRMLIRRSRMGDPVAQVHERSPATVKALWKHGSSYNGEKEKELAIEQASDIDVEALLEAELANAEHVGVVPAASNGAVQVLGGRPPAPFHIPR